MKCVNKNHNTLAIEIQLKGITLTLENLQKRLPLGCLRRIISDLLISTKHIDIFGTID